MVLEPYRVCGVLDRGFPREEWSIMMIRGDQ